MLNQWNQIERHFLKIKPAMDLCWTVGNELDLIATYLSLALLYSQYKEVCNEVSPFFFFFATKTSTSVIYEISNWSSIC